LPLGILVQQLLDAEELREEAPSDEALPIYQLRYAWFLFPAVLLFMLTLLLNEGPRPPRKEPNMPKVVPNSRPRRRAAAALLVVTALACISAAEPPAADALVRQGNEAFARKEYAGAIKFYEQAEGSTFDPGLISFNKAAAYFRLEMHKEAIDCYRRCLEDDAAPAERRGRAHFDLGNVLAEYAGRTPYTKSESVVLGLGMIQHAGDDPYTLGEAIAEYRACLLQPRLSAELRADARHNLELAQLRWLKVRANMATDKSAGDPNDATYPKKKEDSDNLVYKEVNPSKDAQREEASDVPTPKEKPKRVASQGAPVVLPDEQRLQPLSQEQTLATLAREARRIAEARRQQYHPSRPALLTTKDW
jgi:hypothetical protein